MPALGRANYRDFAMCPKHSCKGCKRCAHPVQGPALSGASQVNVNGAAALRVGDPGIHDKGTCCGDNRWIALQAVGGRQVFIEGKLAFAVGDISLHDGKSQGKLMVGSNNVFVK